LQNLLAHAEVFENIVEGFLWRYLGASDFGKGVKNLAEVFREKIAA
jgi:hypothetical protein